MKKLFIFLSTLWMAVGAIHTDTVSGQSACCPEFILKDAVEICPPEGACTSDPTGGQHTAAAACRSTAHTYTVYPNDPAYTYTWTVMGGTPATFTGNPNTIVWGTGNSGYIKVVISNLPFGGSCIDSIAREICLIDGPEAGFTLSPDTVCLNSPVYFTNTSLGGSVYFWDFGDGTTSNLANPPAHYYSSPGTYTVTLSVKDMGAGRWVFSQEPPMEMLVPCGCADSVSMTVVVLPGEGPEIETDCCYGTVCAGDTSSFCTPTVCSTYNWSVTGGTIISGAGFDCIEVVWSSTYSGPTTVSLSTPGCGSAPCPGTTTLQVPVLYPDLPIAGPTVLCAGASGSYSLPSLPGTYYTWTVSGGPYSFNQKDRNTPDVNITFNVAGTYWVKCVYDNPLAGCSGLDSIQVDILPPFIIAGDDAVCEGSTISYNGSGPANWSISPAGPTFTGNGTSTINVTWTPGSYTITAVPLNPSNYCNASAFKNVDVTAKPILNNINGPDSICPGNNFTFSISSNLTGQPFVWAVTGGGSVVSEMGADKDSVVVNLTGPGPWQVSVYQEVEIAPFVYCQSLTKTKNINPFLPPTIAGVSTVCADAVETYTAGGSNPSGNFQWSITPAGQGTIQSGQGTNSVTVLWHGPANTAVLSVTTCSGTDAQSITINGPPTAVASYSQLPVFCLGDNVILTLSTPPSGGYSYQWYENGVPVPSATSASINLNISAFSIAGIYQYYVEVTHNGCSVISNIINVVIEDCSSGGSGGPPNPGNCDVVAFFRTYAVCDLVTLIDRSYSVPPASIVGYLWSVTGPGTGTFTPSATVPNPSLTVSASGTYTITLTVTSSSGCISTWSEVVNILLPTASFNYTTPVCAGSPASFSALPNNPSYHYLWDFGDGSFSYVANTQHAYTNPSPPPYNVMLTITDEKGCVATTMNPVWVDSIPQCNITASDTAFCPGGSVTLTACSGMAGYQWYKNGNAISGANSVSYNVSQHGKYWVEVTSNAGCSSNSDSVYIYMYPLPVAKIDGEKHVCAFPSSPAYFFLSTVYDPDYSYSWSSNPSGATFTPPNSYSPSVTLTMPAVLPATYEFIVEVTDVNTGCRNNDTICVTFFETPVLSVPFLNACEGDTVTLTPTPNDTSMYSYLWSNGATTPVIQAFAPGFYSLTITDKSNGCSASANAGFIHPKPDLSLFPLGCDEICITDTLHLYIPLALNALWPNNTYPSAYPSITWYANGNYGTPIGTGENLAFQSNTPGNYNINVVVQNSFGCKDTSAVFCLSIDTTVTIIVSAETPCGCDTTLSFAVVNSSTQIEKAVFSLKDCFGEFTLCVDNEATYDLVVSNGIIIYNAIVNGVVNYPGGTPPFMIGDPGLCCFAAADSSFVHILAPVTYTSDVVWDNKYYIADNVIVTVTGGAVLDITTVDVVFGECAGIVFQNGSYLRATNSVFRPCEIDKTWKGLLFIGSGEFDNIINESTFKNAEVALYFQDGADAVISDNLFSNCNYGIRVENNNSFNHPVSGNRFVTDDFFPSFSCQYRYSFISDFSTYGVYSTMSRFPDQVSHNQFINSRGTSFPSVYGIYQVFGGGLFSENTFTDMAISVFLANQVYYSAVENNEIEVNQPNINNQAAIYVSGCQGPVVEINNNEIYNNYNNYLRFAAIYTNACSNLSIMNNDIEGFYYGIIDIYSVNHQISNNNIAETQNYGILVYEKTGSRGYITCNTVKMKNFNNSIGLVGYNMSSLSEVSSNCITDCYTAMHYYGFGLGGSFPALPKIRNNFLYNYKLAGINVQNCSGNIGTPSSPGLNTLWSNYNPAVDINSNTSITAADNFGMFNISWPQVQIVSNNPYHSTASCAHQIFNMPSQGKLNTTYTCNNFSKLAQTIKGSGGEYELSANYIELLQSSDDPYTDANIILASVVNPDEQLVNEIISHATLSGNETAMLKFNYFFREGDYNQARTALQGFVPADQLEADYLRLMDYSLQIRSEGWSSMKMEDVEAVATLLSNGTEYSDLAIFMLNNLNGFRDHLIADPEEVEILRSETVKQIGEGTSYLNIYPNPVSNTAYIELIDNNEGDGTLEVYDNSGKLVTNYTVDFVAGGLELDISGLTEGFYIVTLTNTNTGVIQKGKMVKVGK